MPGGLPRGAAETSWVSSDGAAWSELYRGSSVRPRNQGGGILGSDLQQISVPDLIVHDDKARSVHRSWNIAWVEVAFAPVWHHDASQRPMISWRRLIQA